MLRVTELPVRTGDMLFPRDMKPGKWYCDEDSWWLHLVDGRVQYIGNSGSFFEDPDPRSIVWLSLSQKPRIVDVENLDEGR